MILYLHEIGSGDFILFDADQPVAQAERVVRLLVPTRVIVRRSDEGTVLHYLYLPEEFLDSLAGLEQQPLTEALQRSEKTPTPTLDLYTVVNVFEAEAPSFCVLTDDEEVVGFYDVSLPPSKGSTRLPPDDPVPIQTEVWRSLKTEFPDKMHKGEEAWLLVSLARELGEELKQTVPLGSQLDIYVQIRRGFALVGQGQGTLRVTDEDETLPIQFKLCATEIGPARIRVLCFQGGQPLGAVTLSCVVVEAEEQVEAERSSQERSLAPFATTQPDLTLRIFESTEQGQVTIKMELHALDPELELNWRPFGPITLQMDPQSYTRSFFHDIEGLKTNTVQRRAIAARRLALKGASLCEDLLPNALQELLWKWRHRIQTVQILSDEPWIPWEMLQLQGEENGELVEGPFFCEAFNMTRWFTGIGRRPTLRLKRMAMIVPADSGLKYAKKERDYLLSLANQTRQVSEITPTYLDVLDALSQGKHDSWHFTGHGKFKVGQNINRSLISLQDEKLYADEIRGQVRKCGRMQPLVFLNGCQTGRQSLSLTGIGGWAKRFIGAGAAAFIGSLWSVDDDAAHEFAKAFYNHLLSGKTIGEATKKARQAIRQRNDSNWLAYTVFADPLAKVV